VILKLAPGAWGAATLLALLDRIQLIADPR